MPIEQTLEFARQLVLKGGDAADQTAGKVHTDGMPTIPDF